MTLDIREVTLGTLPEFVLREADELECLAGGLDGQMAVKRSVASSTRAFAHYASGELLCLWGYRREPEGATMWLLSTEAVNRHRIAFASASLALCEEMLREFRAVRCLVHCGHADALKWLSWLGFVRSGALTANFIYMQKGR